MPWPIVVGQGPPYYYAIRLQRAELYLFDKKYDEAYRDLAYVLNGAPGQKKLFYWERFIRNNGHDRVKHLEPIPETERQTMLQYLMDHAVDSDAPLGTAIEWAHNGL